MSEATRSVSLSPYITVKDAADAIQYYKTVFGAEERFRLTDPVDGRIGHAELAFGSQVLMISDEYPDFGALGPNAIGGTPVKLHLSVADADKTFALALAQGATELRPVKEQFYGSRSGLLTDPFGHQWFIESKIEDVSPDQMQQRWANSTGV